MRLLFALRRAGSVRELARLGGVSLNAARRFVSRMERFGRFKFVPDDGYFRLGVFVGGCCAGEASAGDCGC